MRIQNLTAHPHGAAVMFDLAGRDCLVVVVKATYRLSTGCADPHLASVPVAWTDELSPSGAVRYPADVVPTRSGTNVVCHGQVEAPTDGARRVPVRLAVGELQRELVAFGLRRWTRGPSGYVASDPEPFTDVDVSFAEAFGGSTPEGQEPRNPLGKGWFPSGDDPEGRELPRLEDPSAPLRGPTDRPGPACFGAVPAHWEPRASLAGTYDERWKRSRSPLPPHDIDERFFQVACGGLAGTRFLQGGERLELRGLRCDRSPAASLPRPRIRVLFANGWHVPKLDVVIIEPAEDRLVLTLRTTVDVTGMIDARPLVRVIERSPVPRSGQQAVEGA